MDVNTDVNTIDKANGNTEGSRNAGTKPVCVLYGMSEEEKGCVTLSSPRRLHYEACHACDRGLKGVAFALAKEQDRCYCRARAPLPM